MLQFVLYLITMCKINGSGVGTILSDEVISVSELKLNKGSCSKATFTCKLFQITLQNKDGLSKPNTV